MNTEEYQKLVKKYEPKEKKIQNAFLAFLVGGCLGFVSEMVAKLLQNVFLMSALDSYSVICFIIILLASLFTAMGFFDDLVSKYKAGFIIPTTGFAHSVCSSALDYRSDGLITGLGANVFKLAGSVILYGMVSAFFFAILGVIFYG